MPDDANDTHPGSPQVPETGPVGASSDAAERPHPKTEEDVARDAARKPSGRDAPLAGEESDEGEHADHATEEAAAYRENDA